MRRTFLLLALAAGCASEPAPSTPVFFPSVAERRAGTAVMLHRGAIDLAVENTLSGLEASFLCGADGVEIDLRRTRDGTIILLHDDWIDRVLDGTGLLQDLSYDELILIPYREPYGLTPHVERVPTFAEALHLCRVYHGLLHLDIKVPGIDAEILRQTEDAGMLEQLATVNAENSEKVRSDARVRPLASQGSLIHGNNDFDAAQVRARLKGPGTLLVDDPRSAVSLLRRPIPELSGLEAHPLRYLGPPVRGHESAADLVAAALENPERPELPRRQALARLLIHHRGVAERELARIAEKPHEVWIDWLWALARLAARGGAKDDAPRAFLLQLVDDPATDPLLESAADACGELRLAEAAPVLVQILADRKGPDQGFSKTDEERRRDRLRIRLRAAAAKALGRIGIPKPETIAALRTAARKRSFHLEGAWQGLDGAEAVKSLAILDPAASAPLFREIALAIDPRLAEIVKHEELPEWLRKAGPWWDFRIKTEAIRALGATGTAEAKTELEAMLEIPATDADKIWRELHWDAARALCGGKWTLSPGKLRRLFEHPTPAVRRTAAVYLLRHFREPYRPLQKEFLSWAEAWLPQRSS